MHTPSQEKISHPLKKQLVRVAFGCALIGGWHCNSLVFRYTFLKIYIP